MPQPKIAGRDEILEHLTAAARKGNVPAMRLLLEELRHDEVPAEGQNIIDELSNKRQKAAAGS